MSDGDLEVTVGGLTFYGQGTPDLLIGPKGFVGWDGGVDMRQAGVARPNAAGSFSLPSYPDSRTLALEGTAFAESNRQLRALGRRFTGILADGLEAPIQVTRGGTDVEWALCELAGKPTFEHDGGLDAAFHIQFWCPDPRIYGTMRSLTAAQGATLPLTHRGNVSAYPFVIIRGDLPSGYTLYGPNGEVFEVTASVISGTKPHSIDFSQGVLKISGLVSPLSTQRADIWTVPPGGSGTSIRLVPNAGSNGTIEVQMTDTYI